MKNSKHWLFDVVILHHGRGTLLMRLDLTGGQIHRTVLDVVQ